jgi:signal transduction histidine kinase
MELRRDLLLMYKEALNNAARHSGASEIATTISVDRAELTIEVRDDGIGFDPAEANSGRGLQTLRSRAERSGVELTLDANTGRGTLISFRLGT